MTEKLIVEKQTNTLIIKLNHPPANTFDAESLKALKQLVIDTQDDKNILTLIITGIGEKFFSAGADLNSFADHDAKNAAEMAKLFGEAFETLSQFEGVSIAAINGYAMGGGLECALACDIRIAECHAIMALPETSVGLLPCGGGTQNLPWLVGEGWAKRMILCGERVDAIKANQIGLVEEVVERNESLNSALKLAEQVSGQSPLALRASKKLIQSARFCEMAAGYAVERQLFVSLFGSEDQREGIDAFLAKRPPVWKNK